MKEGCVVIDNTKTEKRHVVCLFKADALPEFIKALGIAHEGAEAREKLS